jgi:hypothetical protein
MNTVAVGWGVAVVGWFGCQSNRRETAVRMVVVRAGLEQY